MNRIIKYAATVCIFLLVFVGCSEKDKEQYTELVVDDLSWSLEWGDSKYSFINTCSKEYNRFIVTDSNTQKQGVIDSNSNVIVPLEYSSIEECSKTHVRRYSYK